MTELFDTMFTYKLCYRNNDALIATYEDCVLLSSQFELDRTKKYRIEHYRPDLLIISINNVLVAKYQISLKLIKEA